MALRPTAIGKSAPLGDLAEIADADTPVSANWTVKEAGGITPPTSDDYGSWTVEQLRKECTSRKLRLSRKTSAVDRVKHLTEFDAVHLAIVGTVMGSQTPGGADGQPLSKHCIFRLVNVLFSDLFAARFAETGNTPTRQQLDVRYVNAPSSFWRDVGSEFNTNRADYNQVMSTHARFENIDPSVIVIHDMVMLYAMWRKLNRNYLTAMARFTKSGEHGDDFYDYCSGSLEVFYLRECLEVKHDLTRFVEGGMLDEDEFDSLKRAASSVWVAISRYPQSSPMKKMKCELVKSVKTLTSKLVAPASSCIDDILKMHRLIAHVEDRIETIKAKGGSTAMLKVSFSMYREKLCDMEIAFSKAI
ncbi:unnamed protein product [Phytophthora fragariaefolia]|uniref:Unnamed protein product n=1 Tax=Phytophthora fragariaefolia TaxID=1490495 RepID=A0A9W6Y4B6_9STRA|nr:unnamed protein product [Phytophthora fragariaefolia]